MFDKVKNIDTEKLKDVAVVGGIAIAIYLVYKVVKGVQEGKNALGFGKDRERAEATDTKIESLKAEDNPFNPSYLLSRYNSGHEVMFIKAATKGNMFKTITQKLGLFQTYKHPFSFLDDRKKVRDYILKNVHYKTQISDLAKVFKDNGKDLYSELKEGYREQGWLSGGMKAGEVQRVFVDLISKLMALPEGSK